MSEGESIHERIREIMNDNGLNYKSLSVIVDYSDVATRKIVIGENKPKFDFIARLVENLPVNARWLLTGKGGKTVETEKYLDGDLDDDAIFALSNLIVKNQELFLKDTLFSTFLEKTFYKWLTERNEKNLKVKTPKK